MSLTIHQLGSHASTERADRAAQQQDLMEKQTRPRTTDFMTRYDNAIAKLNAITKAFIGNAEFLAPSDLQLHGMLDGIRETHELMVQRARQRQSEEHYDMCDIDIYTATYSLAAPEALGVTAAAQFALHKGTDLLYNMENSFQMYFDTQTIVKIRKHKQFDQLCAFAVFMYQAREATRYLAILAVYYSIQVYFPDVMLLECKIADGAGNVRCVVVGSISGVEEVEKAEHDAYRRTGAQTERFRVADCSGIVRCYLLMSGV